MKNGVSNFKRLQSSPAAKAVAVVLVLVFCFTGAASLFGVAVLASDGAYNEYQTTDFYDSTLCYLVARYHAARIESENNYHDIGYMELPEDPDWDYYGDNTNVLFTLKYYHVNSNGDVSKTPYRTIQNSDGEGVAAEYTFYLNYYYAVWSESGYYDRVELTMYIRAPLIDNGEGFVEAYNWFNFLQNHSIDVILWLAASVLLIIALIIFLMWGAGHKKGVEGIYLNRFHKIPLDLLTVILAIAVASLLYGTVEIVYSYLHLILYISIAVLCAAVASILIALFLITLSARVKAGKWWRNTLIYRWVWRLLRWVWRGLLLILRSIRERGAGFFHMLPLAWRSVLVFLAAVLTELILWHQVFWNGSGWFLILLLYNAALLVGVVYLAGQMRILKKGGGELANGNLSYKINTGKMFWEFRKHGDNLNRISEGMERAVSERMKSEQFKTELITNVSHDIKTPLTSIINYVDLLKKGDVDGAKAAEYLEVLDRQSARLKKLTEDLVEASKATSGVLKVEKSRNDIRELMRQALGEYEERLEKAEVRVIFDETEKPLNINCDGRLMWRVFDNLLSNICKYSQPGTRAFIDMDVFNENGSVQIVFKNTSREILNITAEALMERFVRGDRSRSSEGSGLGLSIARSLTELQGGKFTLYLDGDLFKVIVSFPAA